MRAIAFFDKDGNIRPPETWAEVKEMYCNSWDSCEPCPYAGGYSLTHGGRECTHPLCPHEGNKEAANATQ